MIDEWMTTREAAQLSGYHAEYLRTLIRDGRIEARKFGIVWQVSRPSLLEYMRQAESSDDRRHGPKLSNKRQ